MFVEICGGTPAGVQIGFAEIKKPDRATAGRLASDAAPATTPAKG